MFETYNCYHYITLYFCKQKVTIFFLFPPDLDDPPSSVEEWLMSLQLPDYLETFTSHGYDTMEKVQSILWELQLRTVGITCQTA